ncbi:hypothetical protein [Breoghania sp.]|uniref:hypothetical protein n=1 Tax=Breoghania sp. TaxID=2065378 RepID=UPI0026077D05|nr:hypothetical protein [Breoghania sp.]MDJ0932938.1 hypothetical protein [Breoghania sp.]
MERVPRVLSEISARLAALENDDEMEGEIGYAEVAVAAGGGRRMSMGYPPRPPFTGHSGNLSDHDTNGHDTNGHDENGHDEDELPDLSTVKDVPLESGTVASWIWPPSCVLRRGRRMPQVRRAIARPISSPPPVAPSRPHPPRSRKRKRNGPGKPRTAALGCAAG